MKKLLSGGLAAVIGACIIAPFSVSADNVNNRFVINADYWVDYYEDIHGIYLDREGNYQPITFHAYEAGTYSGAVTDMWYYNNIHYNPNGKALVNYVSDVTGDQVYNDYQQFKIILYPNIHFTDCSYFEFGISSLIYPNFQSFCTRPYEAVKPFNFFNYNILSINYSEKIYLAGEQGMIYPFNYNHSTSDLGYTGFYGFGAYEYDTDIVIDEIDISAIMNTSGEPLYFSIFLPTVSENTVLESPYITPNPPTTEMSGAVSGTIVSNSTGFDANFNFNVDTPDYNGKLDSIESAINPSYDSSGMDEMKNMVDSVADAENSLLISADNDLSSLPGDLDWDEELVEDAVGNPFETFFNENIIGIMVFWVGSIAFISYILFGKWV